MKNKKQVYSWVMYDWANSAFATTVMATILPIFYKDVIAKNLPGNLATSYWGYTTTIAMLSVAVLAPILGAVADQSSLKKHFFKFFAYLGIIATAALFFISEGQYILTSFIFIIASIGFSGGNIFYDSFLPIIADEKTDHISSLGFAAGYLGGGLLLIINLLLIMKPELVGIDTLLATKISFLTVSIWWFLFSIPSFIHLPEDDKSFKKIKLNKYAHVGFRELKKTLRNITQYSELFKFLIAFWFYNDGVGTIMRMATIYGREIGIGSSSLIGALLMTQFIAIPFSLLFGKIGEKYGTKTGIIITLFIYTFITIRGYYLSTPMDFWILAGLVGTAQGGVQALSRSLYSQMVPKNKESEFFGFYGVSSKFSAISGPFVFAIVGQLTGASKYGIFAIGAFFLIGIFMLTRVDVQKGIHQAKKITRKS